MVKEIVKNPETLTRKSEAIDFKKEKDFLDNLIQDMMDTADAHKDNCAGLAAIQIGVPKRVVLAMKEGKYIPFVNPVIVKRSPATYRTVEGCLSLDGEHEVERHYTIMVSYMTRNGKKNVKQFNGHVAQILQHEIDHLNGILI